MNIIVIEYKYQKVKDLCDSFTIFSYTNALAFKKLC